MLQETNGINRQTGCSDSNVVRKGERRAAIVQSGEEKIREVFPVSSKYGRERKNEEVAFLTSLLTIFSLKHLKIQKTVNIYGKRKSHPLPLLKEKNMTKISENFYPILTIFKVTDNKDCNSNIHCQKKEFKCIFIILFLREQTNKFNL